MAAPTGTVSDSESSNSSNDAEELERCREAAMPAWGLEQRPYVAVKPRAGAANNQLSTSQPSLSFITISEAAKEPTKAKVQKVASEDDGFRLFFTSVPGGHEKEESPQPRRKRQPSSSSSEDSDEEWRRCREAAVSASDILQESAIHSPGTVEKEAKKKRKLKKKAKKVASVDSTVAATTPTSMATVQKQKKSGELNGDQVSLGTKKKKKKKAKKPSESSPFPPAKSATAVPAN
ncbi:protein CUSTOS isoform X5 [Symphalangus syndactylus]|uniref:protein CUSTOS isoform X5 n=1 Tax=Symphalangus syndactylus TaxID=9590 RepID=UPI0024429AAE|nr:protein CUSTOS isoform X5 [Symphalangus syndactylus]